MFKAPELARRDIVAFLGASYFRAVDSTYQYGLSARGLAVDTFTDTRKSFPTLRRSGSKRSRDATVFTVYALLDSPSITGAYKFTIHCRIPGYHGRGNHLTPARISNSWVSRR